MSRVAREAGLAKALCPALYWNAARSTALWDGEATSQNYCPSQELNLYANQIILFCSEILVAFAGGERFLLIACVARLDTYVL